VIVSGPTGDRDKMVAMVLQLDQAPPTHDLTGVYVIRDGRAWLRWIAPGDAFGDSIEVRAGLEAKERVALDPSRLTDGAAISEGR